MKTSKRLLCFCLSLWLLVFLCLPVASVSAAEQCADGKYMSDEQRKLFDSGVTQFDICELPLPCQNPTGGGTSLPNIDKEANAKAIWLYFKNLPGAPLSNEQIAGILGNMERESGSLNPEQVQGNGLSKDPSNLTTGGHAYGIIQWDPGAKIIGLMQQAGITKPVYDLGAQLDLVWWHLNNVTPTGARNVLPGLQQQTTIEGAVVYFEEKVEAAGVKAYPDRISFARKWFEMFKSLGSTTPEPNAPPTTTTSSCGGAGGGQVVGNAALPIPKDLFEKNPGWLELPHHDYPAADIPVKTGTAIYAVLGGKVTASPVGGDCGYGVTITSGSIVITYCHGRDPQPVAVKGSDVTPGALIMYSNATGHVIPPGELGSHLHLQIKAGGAFRCPNPLFKAILDGSVGSDATQLVNTLPTSGCIS